MKPVHLSLAGLQSYRDKQEVDFTALSDAGVFGIFGPTGSGKSSILDAITLALYGKVERAPGGTQGIINQMEAVCSVSFTFELTGAGEAERYRVERQYKRTGDITVSQSLSRLIRLDQGEPLVLADKAKDVDGRIQDILGLSMVDFTRAVVLPQGKFAEFLSLKGVERRHMLERLFHLEQYGDLLGAKVSAASRTADLALKQTEAEQLGLGDASEEALKDAKARLETASQAAAEQRKALLEAERTAEERSRLWKLTREREVLAEAEQQLLQRQPEIEAGKMKLRLAEKASRVEHFLKEWETARAERDKAAEGLAAAEAEYEAASADFQRQQGTYHEVKAKLDREAEPLQKRMEGLNRALEMYGEIRTEEERIRTLAVREESLTRELEAVNALAAKEGLNLEKALALQSELKDRVSTIVISPERRDMLQSALLDKDKRTALLNQIADWERELQEAVAHADPLRQSSSKLELRLADVAGLFAELAAQGNKHRQDLTDVIRIAEGLTRLAQEQEKSEKRREQEEFRASLAAKLAGALTEGSPCPVCGSTHHPSLQALSLSAGTSEQDHGERWRELAEAASKLRLSVRELLSVLEAEGSRLVEAAGGPRGSAWPEAAATHENLPTLEAQSELPLPYLQAADQLAGMNSRFAELEQDLKWWQQSVRLRHEQLQSDRNKLAEVTARLAGLDQTLSSLAAKRNDAVRQEQELQAVWRTRYTGLEPEEAVSEWEKLQQLQREQDELRARLDRSGPVLEDMQRKLNQLKEESFRLERELVGISTERKGLEGLVQHKRKRLQEELGGAYTEAETESLYREAAALHQALKTGEAEGRRRLDELQQRLYGCSNRLAASRQAAESSSTALERARTNGERELSAAGFESAEAAGGALLEPTAAAKLEEEIQVFQERLANARVRLEQLAEELAGRSITEAECSESATRLSAERERDEECLKQKAKSERDLEDLEAKHERWNRLEKERIESKALLDRLQKLQSVLRGNALVEFMAEEQLASVSRAASERLGQLTRRRYALETDSTGGFVIRDDANGGLRRPVSTLSGGETFLTSLSLALALSAQIQLNGKFPLEFFFLDEGFGTLDPDLLETVVHALEKLHMEQLTVGVISHVPELKARLPRRLVVHPADPTGAGSQIRFETL